jgi:hypothetical protein
MKMKMVLRNTRTVKSSNWSKGRTLSNYGRIISPVSDCWRRAYWNSLNSNHYEESINWNHLGFVVVNDSRRVL